MGLKYKLSFALLTFLLFLTACDLSGGRLSKDEEFENKIKKMEATNQSAVNYLFYEKNHSKELILAFPFQIEEFSPKEVEFLQDENVVSGVFELLASDPQNNQIRVMLNEYIPEFNRVRLTLNHSDRTLNLHTGQYYFEQYAESDQPISVQDHVVLKYMHSQDQDNKYFSEVILYNKSGSDISVLFPKKLRDTGYENKMHLLGEKKKKVTYSFQVTLPQRYYSHNKLDQVNFETRWIQTTKDKRQKFIFSDFVHTDRDI